MDELDSIDIWPEERRRRGVSDPRVCPSIHGAYHAMTRRLQVVTREFGLDPSEALVLDQIRRMPGCAPVVTRHALGFHRSTLSSILDRLEHGELIGRGRDSWDGRRASIVLTPVGEHLAGAVDQALTDLEQEIRTFTSRADRRGAESVFAAMVAATRPGGALDL
jgi:DNA-binding MarR family transcriptional regulator